jgi:hypothetical protein
MMKKRALIIGILGWSVAGLAQWTNPPAVSTPGGFTNPPAFSLSPYYVHRTNQFGGVVSGVYSNLALNTNAVDGVTVTLVDGKLKATVAASDDLSWQSRTNDWNSVTGKASVAQLDGYLPTNTTLGISATEGSNIASAVTASMMLTGNVATATSAGGVTGGQSNTIATAVQPATLSGYMPTGSAHSTLSGILGSGSLHVSAGETNLIAKAWQNPASATNWTWTSDGAAITLTNYTGPADVVIPDMLDGLPVTGFGTTFRTKSITSVAGGRNVGVIGTEAFYFCSSLGDVKLSAVTNIAVNAFYHCDSLVGVSFPATTSVGDYAFQYCASLASANFPAVSVIGDYALGHCYNLVEVYFGQNAPTEPTGLYNSLTFATATNYVTNPTATGWGATFGGRPVVRLPIYADNFTAAQVGAVPTNDARYLASLTNITGAAIVAAGGLTNIIYYAGTTAYSSNGMAYVGTNNFGGGTSSGGGDIYAASNNVFATTTPITFTNANAALRQITSGITNGYYLTATSAVWTINGTNYVFP